MTMMTIQSQVGTCDPFVRACRLYGEANRISNVCGLRRERNGSRSTERLGKPRQHRLAYAATKEFTP